MTQKWDCISFKINDLIYLHFKRWECYQLRIISISRAWFILHRCIIYGVIVDPILLRVPRKNHVYILVDVVIAIGQNLVLQCYNMTQDYYFIITGSEYIFEDVNIEEIQLGDRHIPSFVYATAWRYVEWARIGLNWVSFKNVFFTIEIQTRRNQIHVMDVRTMAPTRTALSCHGPYNAQYTS